MDHSSPAAKVGDPKFSDIVFSLLIIYIWGLNIQGAILIIQDGRHGPVKALKMPQ